MKTKPDLLVSIAHRARQEHTVLRRKREDGKYVLQVLGPFSCLEVDHEKAEDLLDNSDENFQPSLRHGAVRICNLGF